MKSLSNDKKQMACMAGLILAISCGHYLVSAHFGILHNILQRLYYVPILWSAYRFGERGGIIASGISSLFFLPHILITWQMHPEYQVNQVLEVALFLFIGTSAGVLFERKANDQRLLLSYEKLALFGNLSRSIIRSLKAPLKSLNGMLVSMEPLTKRDTAVESFIHVMKNQVAAIENARNDLIALAERKKLRLMKQPLNKLVVSFASEIDLSLRLKGIQLDIRTGSEQIAGQVNSQAINGVLHHLVGIMLSSPALITKINIHTGETPSYVWIGASTRETLLHNYYLSELSCLTNGSWGEHNLIDVINTMNNHFGDFRCRWDASELVEFILVLPKRLKLPWYLKDQSIAPSRQEEEHSPAINQRTDSLISE